jgi:hypothetical protein
VEERALGRSEHPPIEICIGNPKDDVVIRFRDQALVFQLRSRVWEYSFYNS